MNKLFQYILCIAAAVCITTFTYAEGSREEMLKNLKARLSPALDLSIQDLQLALSIKIHEKYDGASIIADDEEQTFLGIIGSTMSSDSIFNEVGRYGSNVASISIWNTVGRYGSNVARLSPFNNVTSSPPFIVKNGEIIGRLTVNNILPGAVDPNWLKSFYK